MELIEIETKIKSHPIVNHPFLVALREGTYSKTQISFFIKQQFYFSNQFPRCLGMLWSRIPNYQVALPLMRFLAVEHWGSNEDGAHWQLYKKVLAFFNLDLKTLLSSRPANATKQYLDYRFELCRNNTVEEALGCLGFAHELVNEYIFKSYYDGVKSIDDVSEDALQYFKSHVEEEPEDYQIFTTIINNYVADKADLKLVEKGALDTLQQRTVYFDNLQQMLENL